MDALERKASGRHELTASREAHCDVQKAHYIEECLNDSLDNEFDLSRTFVKVPALCRGQLIELH